jgi:hypothetical protein
MKTVELKQLPGIIADGVRVVGWLVPAAAAECEVIDRELIENHKPDNTGVLSTSR